MFASIFAFELRYQLRNPVFAVAVVLFFLLGFGATTVDQIQLGLGGNVHKNAPFAIAQMMQILTLFYMFVSTAFVANVVVRDDESGFGAIIRATRITRLSYLLGRFGGAFTAPALGFLAIPLSVWMGSQMPWLDAEQLGPNRLAFYLSPFVWLALPNILLTSALFFALATTTRSMMAAYLGVVGFLIIWTITSVVLDRNPAYELAGAYGEPLGFGAVAYITKYWTASDRNTLIVPLTDLLLWNRALAVALAAAGLGVAVATFRFGVRPSRTARRAERLAALPAAVAPVVTGPLPRPRFGAAATRTILWARTRLEVGQVVRSPAFLVLLMLGLLNAGGALIDVSEMYGTPLFPVTQVVMKLLDGTFTIIPIIVAIYYASVTGLA